jgi:hypothetical protein
MPPAFVLGTACELIAMSEGSIKTPRYNDIEWNAKFKQRLRAEVRGFYNVLWIEWVDGIVYRKALGQVAKQVWDSHPEEWIDVILG